MEGRLGTLFTPHGGGQENRDPSTSPRAKRKRRTRRTYAKPNVKVRDCLDNLVKRRTAEMDVDARRAALVAVRRLHKVEDRKAHGKTDWDDDWMKVRMSSQFPPPACVPSLTHPFSFALL